MELEKELVFFRSQKEDLISHHEGQFVLIKGESLLGSFTTEAEAYGAGLIQLGNQPFLIKQVKKDGEEADRVPALVLGLLNAYT